MNIILLQPYFDSHIIAPPLSLGYLASTLQQEKYHKVEIIDCNAKAIKLPTLLTILKEKKPDLVGVTILSNFFSEAREAILKIKEISPAKIAIGGPHVTALPEFSLQETNADYAIVGEGERTFAELVKFLCFSKPTLDEIDGLVFRINGQILRNKARSLIPDIDNLPFPAWDLLNPQDYPPAPHGAFYKRFPVAPIITTRGCPFSCKFCSSAVTWRKILRKRNPKSVVDEIQLLRDNYNIKEFHFEDDNFTISREHAISICQEIIKRKLDIVWAAPNGIRVDSLDEELIKVMKQSGCYLLAFGIESGAQEILNHMDKKLDVKRISTILNTVQKYRIETWGFFIIGLPGETEETIQQTISLSRRLPLNRAQFCNFTPLPGTTIFDDWVKDNKLSELEWSKLSFSGNAIYETDKLSQKKLTLLQKKAFRAFYFRPKVFLGTLFKIKPRQIKWLFKRFKAYSYLQVK